MQPVDRAYAHVMQRVNTLNTVFAVAVNVIVVASVWGDRRALTWVAAAIAVLFPANTWISLVLVKRNVRVAETLRFTLTAIGTAVYGHAIGWPLAMWLWLPFMALALPEFSRRVVWTCLVCMWVLIDVTALCGGVAWIYPAAFTLIAAFGRLALDARLRIIRAMFERSEEQRGALDAAHTSLRAETAARERVEVELRHAQKLEAIGRLSAGIAHEINTPLQFVTNNVEYLVDAMNDVLRASVTTAELRELRAGIPDAVRATLEGVQRVSSIVAAMKEFAGPEQADKASVRVERTIAAMLAVAKHEYTYVADVETELQSVPPVACHAGEIGQVLLNLVVNAAHAIDAVPDRGGKKGRITIRMTRDRDHVIIAVADTGVGIPDAIRDKIFEPFFTTRSTSGGSGQGLAISRAIVVDRHGGSLDFETKLGQGTTFFVRLPIEAQATSRVEAA